MGKGALALLINGGSENWSSARWKARFDAVCPDRPVVLLPDGALDPAEVHYAAVWKPKPGELAAFKNLRVIFNLGAGVDEVLDRLVEARLDERREALTGELADDADLHPGDVGPLRGLDHLGDFRFRAAQRLLAEDGLARVQCGDGLLGVRDDRLGDPASTHQSTLYRRRVPVITGQPESVG